MLQYAAHYYDLNAASFPEGETKRALKSVLAKRKGKAAADSPADDKRGGKKRKTAK